jgi:DnaJ-class molecular chaperone
MAEPQMEKCEDCDGSGEVECWQCGTADALECETCEGMGEVEVEPDDEKETV